VPSALSDRFVASPEGSAITAEMDFKKVVATFPQSDFGA
jgi:hypothetical protein